MPTFLNPRGIKTPLGEFPEISVNEGWPDGHLIPRKGDDLGAKIVAFIAKWRGHPNLADGPWDDRTGSINLIPPDQPRPNTDPVPRYRLREDAFLGPSLYSKGAEVDYPGWPARMSDLEPANESAERVFSYASKHGPGRNLTTPPWSAGRLHFENPALFGKPESATPRWRGNSAA